MPPTPRETGRACSSQAMAYDSLLRAMPLFALPLSLLFLREHSDWRVALVTGITAVGIILVA